MLFSYVNSLLLFLILTTAELAMKVNIFFALVFIDVVIPAISIIIGTNLSKNRHASTLCDFRHISFIHAERGLMPSLEWSLVFLQLDHLCNIFFLFRPCHAPVPVNGLPFRNSLVFFWGDEMQIWSFLQNVLSPVIIKILCVLPFLRGPPQAALLCLLGRGRC